MAFRTHVLHMQVNGLPVTLKTFGGSHGEGGGIQLRPQKTTAVFYRSGVPDGELRTPKHDDCKRGGREVQQHLALFFCYFFNSLTGNTEKNQADATPPTLPLGQQSKISLFA